MNKKREYYTRIAEDLENNYIENKRIVTSEVLGTNDLSLLMYFGRILRKRGWEQCKTICIDTKTQKRKHAWEFFKANQMGG